MKTTINMALHAKQNVLFHLGWEYEGDRYTHHAFGKELRTETVNSLTLEALKNMVGFKK